MENNNQRVEAFNKVIADSGIQIELWREYVTEKWKAKIDTSVHDKQIRADERAKVLAKVKELIKVRLVDNLSLSGATKYGNKNSKQQENSYSTVMKYEIVDCIADLLDDVDSLKEQKHE